MNLEAINGMVSMVAEYEKAPLQTKVLDIIPKDDINDKSAKRIHEIQKSAKLSTIKFDEVAEYEKIFLEELALWFKTDFFKWFNVPNCEVCGVKTQFLENRNTYYANQGMLRVEVYKCFTCNKYYYFPRSHDALVLLETRVGRCSEWAQCFTLMCRALGYDSRFVHDVTDHVWTEVYSNIQKRWIHIDPCEGVVDQPLLYELGWNKKLSYIVGISATDIQDVTWRYSCNHQGVRDRRKQHIDRELLRKILITRQRLQANISETKRKFLTTRLAKELGELICEPKSNGTYSGRISGPEEWRKARGELGKINTGYKWTPTTSEVNNKLMKIMLNSSLNAYQRGKEELSGWENYTYAVIDVFRKIERDWEKSYLARNEGSDGGIISWMIDVTGTNLTIGKVEITCPILAIEGAIICWAISRLPTKPDNPSTDDGTYEMKGNENFPLPTMLKNHLSSIAPSAKTSLYFNEPSVIATHEGDVQQMIISVALLKGNNWQHAQIFRQDLKDKSFSFGFIINLL